MKKNAVSAIGKVGMRRQVVIPQAICDELGLVEGGFVEVSSERGAVVIRPKMFIDPDTYLTGKDAESARTGMSQLKAGKSQPWRKAKDALGG